MARVIFRRDCAFDVPTIFAVFPDLDSAIPHDSDSFPEAWALAFQGFSVCLGALKTIDDDCCHFGRLCTGLTSGFRNVSIFVINDVFATLQWPGCMFSCFVVKK